MRFHLAIATCAVAVPFGCTRRHIRAFLAIAHGAFPACLPVGYHLLSGLIHGHTLYLLFLRLIGLSGALRPELFAACPAFRSDFDISEAVRGVALLTFLVGLQYWLPRVRAPHGFPVLVSFHASFSHLFRLAPALVFRVCPLSLRHLAMACDARALGNVRYLLLTWL